MRITAILLYVLTTLSIYANDTVMVITGGTLHPITTTNVSIDYERLNIICKSPQSDIVLEPSEQKILEYIISEEGRR
jgi:hypothetical protein